MAILMSAVVLVLIGVGVLLSVRPDDPVNPAEAAQGGGLRQEQPNGGGGQPLPTPTRKGNKPGNPKTGVTTHQDETGEPDPDESDDSETDNESSSPDPEETEETNKYTPTQVCGEEYEQIDQADLKSPAGVVKGRVYLLYRNSDGTNCVVTLRTTGLKKKGAASAFLQVQGKGRKADSGTFQYYAGPVKAVAPGTCVKWGGSVGALTFESDFEHCG
jgi:serine/threonine-protein kinase